MVDRRVLTVLLALVALMTTFRHQTCVQGEQDVKKAHDHDPLLMLVKSQAAAIQTLQARLKTMQTQLLTLVQSQAAANQTLQAHLETMQTQFLTLVQSQAAAIQTLQARLETMQTQFLTLVNFQAAAIQTLQARLETMETQMLQLSAKQGLTAGFSVDFGTEPYHAVRLALGSPILFNNVITNVGNAYDPTNGYFSAPHSGLYSFSFHFMGSDHKIDTGLGIYVGNSKVARAYAEGNSADKNDQGSCSAVVWLTGGQKVSVQLVDGEPEVWGSFFTSFSGALIHTD